MTEHVMLKTESVQSSSLNKLKSGQNSDATTAKQNGEGDFSAEFNKHIDRASQHPTQTAKASKQTKPEKNGVEDGKKLPQKADKAEPTAESKPTADKHADKKQQTETASEQQTITAADEKSQHNTPKLTAKPENPHQPEKASIPVENDIAEESVKKQPQQQNKTPVSEKKQHDDTKPDKVVVADAHAVEHASTDKVSMQPNQHHSGQKKDKATAIQSEATQQHPVIPVSVANHGEAAQQHDVKKVKDETTDKAGAATPVSTDTDVSKNVIASDNTTKTAKTDQDTQQDSGDISEQLTRVQGKFLPHRQHQLSHTLTAQHQHQNAVDAAGKPSVDVVEKSTEVKNTVSVAETGVGNDSKKSETAAPVLRPDIMHALKQRSESGGDKLTAFKTVQKTMTEDASHLATLAKQAQPASATVSPTGPASLSNALMSPQSASTPVVTGGTPPQAGIQSSMTGHTAMLDIQPTMQSAAWAKVMSSRVLWMAKEGIQRAQIKLNPSNLGPIEVRLHMHNDQASVTFVAHHAMTRDALEQALPKLRDSFVDNGLALTNAEVSQQQYSDNQSGAGAGQHESTHNEIIVQANGNEDDILSETEHTGENAIAGLSLYA